MSDHRELDDDELDRILSDARQEEFLPPAHLVEAILADAADVSADRAGPVFGTGSTAQGGWWSGLRNPFGPVGGWSGAGILAACAVAGFVAGVNVQDGVLSDAIWGETSGLDSPADQVTRFFDLESAEG